MKKLLLILVFPVIGFAQQLPTVQGVGINTTQPKAKLDVNGNARFQIPDGSVTDSVVVINNGFIKKIPMSHFIQQSSGTCPNFLRNESSGYILKFSSPSSIPNPNATIVIQGKTFVPAGAFTLNNLYHFYYTNTSGQVLNINNPFSVNFTGLHCNY